MTDKPDLTKVWAENADPADIKNPDLDEAGKFQLGWLTEVPPHTWFNYIQNNFSAALAHLNEYGIAQWDSDTTYPVGGWARSTVDNKVYQSLIATNQGNEPSASPSQWELADTEAYKKFGLGTDDTANIREVTDFDDRTTKTGFYRYLVSAANKPNAGPGVCIIINNGPLVDYQIAFTQNGNELFSRVNVSGTWSDWVSVTESRSYEQYGLGLTSAKAAIPGDNADTLRTNGVYRITSITSGATPPGLGIGQLYHFGQDANNAIQMATIIGTELTFTRTLSIGVWSDWIPITPVGVNQTWQDLTGSRAFGVVYTNTTGRPIHVAVSSAASMVSNNVTMLVDGLTVSAHANGDGTSTKILWASAIVPDGSTYQVANTGGSLGAWSELRE